MINLRDSLELWQIVGDASALKRRLRPLARYIWTHDAWLALVITSCIVAVGLVAGWSNNHIIPTFSNPHYHYRAEPGNPLSFIANWDSPDYLAIASSGYTDLFDANFFPLYPLLIRLLTFVVRSPLVAALLIAWASLVAAIYFFIKILKRIGKVANQHEALKAVSFFVLFPTGVFLIAPYTESLFAMLALGAIYFALQKRTVASSLLLLLCTACHITGVFVVIWVALIMWERRAKLRSIAAVALTGILGLVGFMLYLQIRFHDALAFVVAQSQIHGWLHHSYWYLLTTADPFNIVFVIALLVTGVYYWRKNLKSFAIYSWLFLAIPLAGHQFGGFNRYILMAFPLQFMLYEYFRGKPRLYPYVLALLGVIWMYFTLQYAGGYIGS